MKTLLFTVPLIVSSFFTFSQSLTISQVQGMAALSPYDGQVVTTSGIVSAIHGTTGYFIQDNNGPWSGIYVYSPAHTAILGDDVTITGEVDEFFDLTEIKNVSSYTVNSSGNPLPSPLLLTTGNANQEEYEGVLVQIEDGICTADINQFNEWLVDDGSGSLMIDDLIFAFDPVPGVSYNVRGPLHYSFGDYKIVPASAADITINLSLYITNTPYESNITTSSLNINWSTNDPGSSIVEYGLTPGLELGSFSDNNPVVDHSLALTGLSPATVYYVRPYSIAGIDTTPSLIFKVMTASNSSGQIDVHFNHSVDINQATISEAKWTLNIIDTIISFIDKAQTSLDITMYEVEDSTIIDAINRAYDRGVIVRYISDDVGNNDTLQELMNPAIPVLEGNASGIMHDKFIIIDRDDVNNSWVMTGSFNHTWANLGWDFNNLISIQDQSLARAYTIEFEEMWGSSSAMFNMSNAKFGNSKTNNTPHRFNIGGRGVELYFSPSDNTEKYIKEKIDSAKSEVEFALLIFTSNPLGSAIVDADQRGVSVRGMIDYVESSGSEYDYLLQNGIDVLDYMNADSSQWPDGPTLHHKYVTIDFESTSENPLVITGSHNWTAAANNNNDENTLIIYDAEIANLYHQEFNARYNYVPDTIAVIDTPITSVIDPGLLNAIKVFPNPSTGEAVSLELPGSGMIKIYSIDGNEIYTGYVQNNKFIFPITSLQDGIYIVEFFSRDHKRMNARFIKQ